MKINESKHGFVVKKRTEVSELNATMYEMEHIKTHLKLAWLKRDEENKTRIFRDKMLDDRPQLLFNYRNLMLLNGEKWDSEERMDIAFRMDDKDKERKAYDELYNSYVLGGVEVLYERIFDNASKPEEYLMNFYEFLEELEVRIYKKDVGLE